MAEQLGSGWCQTPAGNSTDDSALPLLQLFLRSIRLFVEQRAADVGAAVFDKDDALAVEFVVAAANLRAFAYGIPTQTLFDAKVNLNSTPKGNTGSFVVLDMTAF